MNKLMIVTALMAEAVPIIDAYKMRKEPKKPGYHHYSVSTPAGPIELLVCGLGTQQMREGLEGFFRIQTTLKLEDTQEIIWINIGVAGALSHSLGELLWVGAIGETEIARLPQTAEQIRVISLDTPSIDYKVNTLFDMEAETFLDVVMQYSTHLKPQRRVFCAKVVSDNQQAPLVEMSVKSRKKWLSALLQKNIASLRNDINNIIKTMD
ncbi:MAG: hypothetical protein V3V09_03480 [Arenicellales bacterium]